VSREESLQRLADISNAMRQMDIDLGVRQEQERIIKLLKSFVYLRAAKRTGYRFGKQTLERDEIIALIKGKNK
jgi:isopentenyldiphosphate isomerase